MDPNGPGNAANHYQDLDTHRRNLVTVQRMITDTTNHLQELSRDCQDPSSSSMLVLVAPGARKPATAFRGPWWPRHRSRPRSGPRHGQRGANDCPEEAHKHRQSHPGSVSGLSGPLLINLVLSGVSQSLGAPHGISRTLEVRLSAPAMFRT